MLSSLVLRKPGTATAACRAPHGISTHMKLTLVDAETFRQRQELIQSKVHAAGATDEETEGCYSRCGSAKIALIGVHRCNLGAAAACNVTLDALAEVSLWPAISSSVPPPPPPAGAWAPRRPVMSAVEPDTDAASPCTEDVLPRRSSKPYAPPARRAGASAAILAGCRLAAKLMPKQQQAAPAPAPYRTPHLRSVAEQAAAAELGRSGRPCAWPQLTAGMQLHTAAAAAVWTAAPFLLYRMAACGWAAGC